MPRTPYATRTYDTPQKGPRIPAGVPTFIVIHHAATLDFDAVINLELGARQVSSTVIIKDGDVASMFDETYRAWSLSSQYWDSVSLSSETCNETTAPGWTISEASYATLAKVVADWCRRYLIPCDRTHIMGHREVYTRYGESYATACPGGIDLDRVVRDAAAILTAAPITPDIDYALMRRQKESTMYIAYPGNPAVYNVFTDANGHVRMRLCTANEAAFATKGGLVIPSGADSAGAKTLENLGRECGYVFGQDELVPTVKLQQS